jgi:hypothetical protein
MYRSVDFHGLFLQLQSRFPGSSLVADLVQIQGAVFVVKAVVSMGGTVLATALSAADSVEVAEDQARLRVLGFLGVVPVSALNLENLAVLSKAPDRDVHLPIQSAIAEPAQIPTLPTTDFPLADGFSVTPASPSKPTVRETSATPDFEAPLTLDELTQLPGIVKGIKPKSGVKQSGVKQSEVKQSEVKQPQAAYTAASLPSDFADLDGNDSEAANLEKIALPDDDVPNSADYSLGYNLDSTDYSELSENDGEYSTPLLPIAEPEAIAPAPSPKPKPSPSKNGRKTIGEAEKAIAPNMSADAMEQADQPDDLSSLIALTDVEMDRIGWTKLEGRDYLKQTYGKATRQKLEVDELLDFLNYLRALPSPYGL